MVREISQFRGPGGCILTNCNVWSPDSEWIVYDTRSDPAGEVFDGTRIEMIHATTGERIQLYEARHGAGCGVVTWHPIEPTVVFIHGPEHPTPDWTYGFTRRQGVIVDARHPGVARSLDARNIVPPFTPGALRGGTHLHVWHPQGDWISFTYEDHWLSQVAVPTSDHDVNQRNVGVAIPKPVTVPQSHPRNHSGDYFSVLVTRTTATPRPGSDDITRASEEAWVGSRRQLAFQGQVVTVEGKTISEVFVVDLPDDLTIPGEGPLEGTSTRRPYPPRGVVQRRLTFTASEPYPGLHGPRHWLRSSPDGRLIGFLRPDRNGIVQFWTVSPDGGPPMQITDHPWPVASAFTWHPNGRSVAYVLDHSVCLTDVATGRTQRLTDRYDQAPRPESCVMSPDGTKIAFVRHRHGHNQISVIDLD
jgi:WD40 repeat protein